MGEIAVSFNVQLWLWTERVVNLIIRRRESQSITTRINWLRVEHPARATNKGNWHPWLLLANCVAISSLYCFNLLVKLEQWTVRFSRGHCAWLTVITTYILQWNGKRFYCFKCVLIMFHGAFYLFHLIRRKFRFSLRRFEDDIVVVCCGKRKFVVHMTLWYAPCSFFLRNNATFCGILCVSEALTTL